MSRVTIRVGEWSNGTASTPVPLHTLGKYGNVVRTIRHPVGDWALTWDMDLFRGVRPSALGQGRTVEAWLGGTRIWGGTMDEPDWGSGSFSASGFGRQLEHAYALDGNGKATSLLGLAIFCASNFVRKTIGSGLLLDPDSASFQQMPAATEPNNIAALADQWCALNGMRWWVDSGRAFWYAADPTTPTLFVLTDQDLGVSTDLQATDILVGYERDPDLTYSSKWVSATDPPYRVERLMDLTSMGPLKDAAAVALGRDVLTKTGPQAIFTSGVTVSRGQVTNGGGAAMHLAAVKPGQMCRMQGMRDPRNGALSTDVLVGETVWDEDAGTVQITPIDADRDDFAAVVESIGGQAA